MILHPKRSEIASVLNRFHSDSTFGTGAAIDAIFALFPVAAHSVHSEDFLTVFDEYEKAALTGVMANPDYSALGDETLAKYAEDAATASMKRRAARQASSTPEGAKS